MGEIFLTFSEAQSATQFILARIRNLVPAEPRRKLQQLSGLHFARIHRILTGNTQGLGTRTTDSTRRMIPPQAIPIHTRTISCLTSDLHAKGVAMCHVVTLSRCHVAVFRRQSFPYQNTRTCVSFCARCNGSSNINNELQQVFADQYGCHVSFCNCSRKREKQRLTQKWHLYGSV